MWYFWWNFDWKCVARHGGDKRNCEVFFKHWVPWEIQHLNLTIFVILNKDGDNDGKDGDGDGKDVLSVAGTFAIFNYV